MAALTVDIEVDSLSTGSQKAVALNNLVANEDMSVQTEVMVSTNSCALFIVP